jgi:hypothetical protein
MAKKKLDSDQFRNCTLEEIRYWAGEIQAMADDLVGVAIEAEKLQIPSIPVRGTKTFYETHLKAARRTVDHFREMLNIERNANAVKRFGVGMVAEEAEPPSVDKLTEDARRKTRSGRNRKTEDP